MKIFAIIVGIVVIGGGAYFFTKSPSVENKSAVADTEALAGDAAPKMEDGTTPSSEKITSSPTELAKKGGQYKCTFEMKDQNTDSSGVVYIDGKKFRGDFKSTIKVLGQTIESHSISDGAYSYTWTSAVPTGFKTPIVSGGSNANGDAVGSMDFGAQGANASWSCVAEKFGADKLALPAGIQFTEMSSVKK